MIKMGFYPPTPLKPMDPDYVLANFKHHVISDFKKGIIYMPEINLFLNSNSHQPFQFFILNTTKNSVIKLEINRIIYSFGIFRFL